MAFHKPKLIYVESLPHPESFGEGALLIHDRLLLDRVPHFKEWVKGFQTSLSVDAGERLKDLAFFPERMEQLLREASKLPNGCQRIIAAGGGSVGDFSGFVASILKRGVPIQHIPSTWLAAIDSAHGGKNALNAGGVKNQVGTFHFPEAVYLIRSLLQAQGGEREADAAGELAKIALIDGGAWTKKIEGPRSLWSSLKPAIEAKYRIVASDPLEKKGTRRILNLGHTLGHAIEAWHGLPHGESVAQGLLFALEWSRQKKFCAPTAHSRMQDLLEGRFGIQPLTSMRAMKKIPRQEFLRLVEGDKKRLPEARIHEVFLAGFGKPRLQPVKIDQVLDEATRQGWIEPAETE